MLRKAAPLAALIAIAAAVLTWAYVARDAPAQSYPPPIGSMTVAVDTTVPAVGTNTELSATVRDTDGNPIADTDVTFTITSQPGDDAALGSLSKTVRTDQNGVARVTLYTGTTKGEIVVTVLSQDKTSQITLQAGGALPPTGEAPLEGSGGMAGWLIALIAGGALIAVGAGALAIRARRRA